MGTVVYQTPLSRGFSGQEYWHGLPCLPPGDLPNPGIETRSPTLQADSLPAESPGKSKNNGWVDYSFSRGTSWPRNQTRVFCIAGGFFTSWSYQGSLRLKLLPPNYLKCPGEDFLSPDVSLPLPPTLISADPLFSIFSKTSVCSLSTPLGHLLYYSFAAISQGVTSAWETTLEGTASQVVSTNLG